MNSDSMHYNYVIFSYFKPTYDSLRKDYSNYQNVRICKNGIISENRLLALFHKLHWSHLINSKIRLPFKKIWFKRMTDGNFSNSLPTCYVFMEGQYCIEESGLIAYIKKLNPHNKVVSHFTDIFPAKTILTLKEKCDMLSTYDSFQAKKYNIEYYNSLPEQHKKENFCNTNNIDKTQAFEQDVYFIGFAKDRLKLLHSTYLHLTSHNVRCLFQLAGVPKKDRISGKGLQYIEKQIPYEEVLKIVEKSRCVLEISQSAALAPTMRTKEAILKQRKLLTNRKNANDDNLFSDKQLSIFDTPENIDISFLTSNIDYDVCIDPDVYSPYPLLSFLEEKLEQKFHM